MSVKLRMRIEGDNELMQTIKAVPHLLGQQIKKHLAIAGEQLRESTLQKLKQYQKNKWILEDVISSKVTGSIQRGRITLKLGFAGNQQPERGDPQQYGFYIEHGNEGKRKGEYVRSRKNRVMFHAVKGLVEGHWRNVEAGELYYRAAGDQRKPRPFLNPAMDEFRASGLPDMALQNAIDETARIWNEAQENLSDLSMKLAKQNAALEQQKESLAAAVNKTPRQKAAIERKEKAIERRKTQIARQRKRISRMQKEARL